MRGSTFNVHRLFLLAGAFVCGSLGLLLALATAWVQPLDAAEAKLTGPRANDRQVTRAVNKLIKDTHLSKHPLDDEISQRGLHLFIKTLDNRKQYFLQSDIAEFEKHKNDLDDQVNSGDISFAYTVFQRFLARVDERVVQVEELLKEDFDFTKDEVLSTNWDKLEFPRDAAEAKERWRKSLKNDLLIMKTDKDEKAKKDDPKVRLSRRIHTLAKRWHQTDADELLEMYLTSLTSSYDPHTAYMSPSTLESFKIQMRLNLDGIGAVLKLGDDGFTVIEKIMPGGAADKQGQLKTQDRVVKVGQGADGEMVDVTDMKLNDVVSLIRGKAGTTVRLGVLPGGAGEMTTIQITRAKIELKDSEARGTIVEEGKKADGSPYKVGYINLPSFYSDFDAAQGGGAYKSTTVDVKKILDDFNAKGVDVLLLDLRFNGGGSLKEAINMTGLFIEEGPVVQVKDLDGRVAHYDDLDREITWKGPMVVMTNKFSASASEILAGAIQDYGRGLVIGDASTHGKGTVQGLTDVGAELFKGVRNPPNLGALKTTIQQFYRPNGDSTQKRGVLADVVLPSLTDHMGLGESDLDYAMNFDKVAPADFVKVDKVSAPLIVELKSLTQSRQEKSPDFARRAKDIARVEERRKKKEVPLNEGKFLAMQAEMEANREAEKALEETGDSKEVFKRTFYENEAIAITLDYVRLLNKEKVARLK